MILHLSINTPENVQENLSGFSFATNTHIVLVTSSKTNDVPEVLKPYVLKEFHFEDDIQLASRKYINETREIVAGNFIIGGKHNNTPIITGPCSIESKEQIEAVSEFIVSKGLHFIRGGCFKPRTSPYSFQGLGMEGLHLLNDIKKRYGLITVTEVKDSSHVNEVIANADIIQIGAKAMYDQSILKACSKTQKPILLKRGFGTTLQEFVQAAEFILAGGNPNVMLCERGIRTFETKTRFTLDLCGVVWLKEYTNLPVILDPSHALGYRYGIKDLSKACMALGVDGLLIEVHPTPELAKSDASQQLNFAEFSELLNEIAPVANAVKKNIC